MNTIQNKQVSETLAKLHVAAATDGKQRQQERRMDATAGYPFWQSRATTCRPVNSEEGRLLYLLAATAKAKTIVEFGCSWGISTIYLATAARDNGGCVITTDLEATKIARARKNLDAAGLGNIVEIREGNALQTLAFIAGPIDFLFLDGAKDLYLTVFKMLQPRLRKGAIVFADNTDRPETWPLVNYLTSETAAFTTVQLLEGRALVAYIN